MADHFRLLVPDESGTDTETVELQGQQWSLRRFPEELGAAGMGEYTCVSYAWGEGRVPHPFREGQEISDRTWLAAETTIRNVAPKALWLDALCVPVSEPERTQCLDRMGAIYGHCQKVVVVLSIDCEAMLQRVARQEPLDREALLAFENDRWLTRIWNYQELVNGEDIRFVVEGRELCVEAEEVLNKVGFGLHEYRKEEGLDPFEMRDLHPRLDSLEDLILDWKLSAYLDRSAYRIMCGMFSRSARKPEDQFTAMVGALVDESDVIRAGSDAPPAEQYMQVCEAKGDFSFIYTSAPRNPGRGRRWRPAAAKWFDAVFPWTTYGAGQSGTLYSDSLQLDGMNCLEPAPLTDAALKFLADWLGTSSREPKILAGHTFQRLRRGGFSGSEVVIEVGSGLFYPQDPFAPAHDHSEQETSASDVLIAVATGLQMPHGAPALALRAGDNEPHKCLGVGIYVGPVKPPGESVRVA